MLRGRAHIDIHLSRLNPTRGECWAIISIIPYMFRDF